MNHRISTPLGLLQQTLVQFVATKFASYLFVDKTLFIRDVLNVGDEVCLITRPRRFGKTLNMSMLEHFFASNVDGQSTKDLFNGLQVSKYPNVMEYQGKYPVIFITFKEIRGKNFEEAFSKLKNIIFSLFKEYKKNLYDDLDIDDRRRYQSIIEESI